MRLLRRVDDLVLLILIVIIYRTSLNLKLTSHLLRT